MYRPVLLVALGATLLIASAENSSATILQDLASSTILEDFQFDDPNGTNIEGAANSANPGNMFDDDGDNANVVTNGSGQLDVSGKNNTAFGSNYLDVNNFSTGRYLGVIELTWDFDPNVYDPSQDEEIRLTFINNDPRGTQVTAQVEIQRNGSTELEINGTATNGTTLGPDPNALNISQTTKFIAILDADLDADTYEVHYSDDAGLSFNSLGSGSIDPGRILNAVRLVLNEDFVGDNVLIDRVYLARVPEPSSMILAGLGLVGLAARRRKRS